MIFMNGLRRRQSHSNDYCRVAIIFFGFILLSVAAIYGQSLGDVARQQRQKAKATHSAHKIITNEDIPKSPRSASQATSDSSSADGSISTPDQKYQDSSSSSAGNNLMTAEQWKAQIQAQQDAIASLQSQIDKLNASIHFVEANRYYNGVQYNQHQLKKQEQVQQMQKQLEEQKKKLEDMQEGARKAGFGNAVYEP